MRHRCKECLYLILLATVVAGTTPLMAFEDFYYNVKFISEPHGSPREDSLSMQTKTKNWDCLIPPRPASAGDKLEADNRTVNGAQFNSLFGNACFYTQIEWWTYEFCFDKWIRQFHTGDHEYLLGLGKKALWDPITAADLEKRNHQKVEKLQSDGSWRFIVQRELAENRYSDKITPYYSTYLTDGTLCALNSQPRETEVRMRCSVVGENSFTLIERASCAYILEFQSVSVCDLPEMRKVMLQLRTPKPELEIQCHFKSYRLVAAPKRVVHTRSEDELNARIRTVFASGCYIHSPLGWWAYQFCIDKWLKQIRYVGDVLENEHVLGVGYLALADDSVSRQTIKYPDGVRTAGNGISQLLHASGAPTGTGDWVLEKSDIMTDPYYSTLMLDGSFCAATGEGRETEVRLFCTDILAMNNSMEIQEKAFCRYVMNFYSTIPCYWKDLQDAYKERFKAIPDPSAVRQTRIDVEIVGWDRSQGQPTAKVSNPEVETLQSDAPANEHPITSGVGQVETTKSPEAQDKPGDNSVTVSREGGRIITTVTEVQAWAGAGTENSATSDITPDGVLTTVTRTAQNGVLTIVTEVNRPDPDVTAESAPQVEKKTTRSVRRGGKVSHITEETNLSPPGTPEGTSTTTSIDNGVIIKVTTTVAGGYKRIVTERTGPDASATPPEYKTVPAEPPADPKATPKPAPKPETQQNPPAYTQTPKPKKPHKPIPPQSTNTGTQAKRNVFAFATVEEIRKIESLFAVNCYSKNEGWWSYEFCFDKWLRQYHDDNQSGTTESEFYLGLGVKAHNVDSSGKRKNKYKDGSRSGLDQIKGMKIHGNGKWTRLSTGEFSTEFIGGTVCDATGNPRKTEILLQCPEGVNTAAVNELQLSISEPRPCEYTLTFKSMIVCTIASEN